MDPIYKVPGSEGYTSDQAKAIGTSGKIIWAKHSSSTPSEEGIQSEGSTHWAVAADTATSGFKLPKAISFNHDGTEAYVADTISQTVHVYDYDKDAHTLTAQDVPVYQTLGRLDNLKTTEGTNNVLGGYCGDPLSSL